MTSNAEVSPACARRITSGEVPAVDAGVTCWLEAAEGLVIPFFGNRMPGTAIWLRLRELRELPVNYDAQMKMMNNGTNKGTELKRQADYSILRERVRVKAATIIS